MGLRIYLLLAVTLVTALHFINAQEDDRKKVVCYFGSWSVYRPGDGRFDVENIDPYVCTHLMYGFTGLSPTGEMIYLDAYNDDSENWGKGAMKRFAGLKKINPLLKTLIAIGGWNEGSEKYSKMVETSAGRAKFIQSCVDMIVKEGFDGLDLDWEYPAHRGGKPEDKFNFATLVREMRIEFDKYGFLLTAAVSAGELTLQDAYDVPSLARNLDFINIMAYDFHGGWETWTGHHSPMYALPTESGELAMLNVNHSVHAWLSRGAPREKLVLGMGAYGRGWVLDNADEHGDNATANRPIDAGPYTRENGFWGYLEICQKQLAQPGQWTVVREPYIIAPYAYNGLNWIGYDDIESLTYKSNYILDMGLAGGMVWSIDTDDYLGDCGEPFALIKTIHRTLNGEILIVTPPTTTEDPNQPSTTTTPAPPAPGDVCKQVGLNPDPHNECSAAFYSCSFNNGQWTAVSMRCAPGTIFHPSLNTCTYPSQVPGCEDK